MGEWPSINLAESLTSPKSGFSQKAGYGTSTRVFWWRLPQRRCYLVHIRQYAPSHDFERDVLTTEVGPASTPFCQVVFGCTFRNDSNTMNEFCLDRRTTMLALRLNLARSADERQDHERANLHNQWTSKVTPRWNYLWANIQGWLSPEA
ncbi:hypothetical protein HGRIS_007002 [Hohenbuehelia grisea]|uniref:Uncharacterized protein n=1 Tax=Hohenbuehelia grisea TaxID=104357 RepID=A0ABR3JBG6_9AGAR